MDSLIEGYRRFRPGGVAAAGAGAPGLAARRPPPANLGGGACGIREPARRGQRVGPGGGRIL